MDIADKKLIAEIIAKYFTMIENIKQLKNAATAVEEPEEQTAGYGDVDNVVDEVMGDLLDAVLASLAGGDKPSSEKPDPQPVECTPLDQETAAIHSDDEIKISKAT